MKKFLMLVAVLSVACLQETKADVDPNFYVYLCFGQSNMEGNAQWEAQDVGNVDERFQMLATCNFDSPKRTLGNWYTAECPIVSPVGKLGPSDYFGRTMVSALPDKKVGVVAVAMGGSPIEMFDKDLYQAKLNSNPNEWWAQLAKRYYGGNPYGRLIEMAKKAQQVGVIKGILLHQGESNNGEADWPQKVKTIYNRLITDLGLNAADIPLFVGETVSQAEKGSCWYHNTVIAKVPNVIPNSYVIPSTNCPQKGDGLHFTPQGYRIMGTRYAKQALKVLGVEAQIDDPAMPTGTMEIDKRFTSLDAIGSTPFAIVDEQLEKAIYGTTDQNLGFDIYANAFADTNTGYLFKLEKVTGGYLLRLITPGGTEYSVCGGYAPGYLNGFSTVSDCSFILGLNNQNGQDVKDGALWDIQYVDGKGFTLKNLYTRKYLKDNLSAKYDDPTYFSFCTLRYKTTGVGTVLNKKEVNNQETYDLSGRRVDSSNLRPGLYIRGGKKILLP